MIRSYRLSLGFALLIASAVGVCAQSSSPTDAAIKEAVVREYNTKVLQQKLAEAQETHRRGDLPTAAKLYEDSYTLVQSIGPGNLGAETDSVIQGLTDVGLTLAQDAQRRHDWNEADVRITRVLKVNPKSAQALEFKRANDKTLAAMVGMTPSRDVIEKVPGFTKEKIANSTKIQNAKLYFENGKYAEAEALLKQVLIAEPGNYAAAYYSSLIKEQLDANATLTRAVQTKQRILEVEGAWDVPTGRDRLPKPNPWGQTNLVHTSSDRQAILLKLDRIRLDTVMYDGLPLSEVVRSLAEECKRRDPDKQGINFFIAPNADTAAAAPASAPGFGGEGRIDPNTAFPGAAPAVAAEPVDMSSISVKMYSPASNIKLQHLLDVIIKSADRPIKYSIEDYGIIFTLRGAEPTPLYTRLFKIDPNTFWMGLQNVEGITFGDSSGSSGGGGGGGGNSGGGSGGGSQSGAIIPRVSVAGGNSSGGGGNSGGGGGGQSQGGLFSAGAATGANGAAGGGGGGQQQGQGGALPFITQQQSVAVVQQVVRNFFNSVGVDLSAAGKSVFFNDRQGTLFVRATLQDLDIIEQAVQVLNIIPPQVNIKAKFAEVGQNDKKAVGFDWYLGNMLMGGKALGAQGGTAPSYVGAPSAGNPSGVFPGPGTAPGVGGPGAIAQSASDSLLTSGLRNTANAPALGTLTGILTDPQFRLVVHALEQREGVELLSAPDVTTVSGRQAQLQVVDIRTIVTTADTSQTGSGGNNNNNQNSNSGGGVVAASLNYGTQQTPFGPVLDVIPYVSADGYTVQMVIIPTITEFVGYDDPGGFVPQSQSVGAGNVGLPLTAQLPLPHYRVRQVTTTSIIWDGQTIVLGGLLSESVSKFKDKVPVLGDLPFVGRLFRSEANITEKKNLVIFVTPTIIDPAGNRLHTDDQLPFTQPTIPQQRPVVQAGAGAAK